jgi:AcrR family transcriptional regulator
MQIQDRAADGPMADVTRRGPNKDRAEATRRELVAAARDLFLRDGYAATSPNDIAVACGVTKGALYHHFTTKTGLLDAVVRLVQRELRAAVLAKASAAGDSWDRIEAGCLAYLDTVSATPGMHRLLYADAMAGLGWQRWREIDEQYWSRDLRAALTRVLGKDSIQIGPVAAIILGTLTQVAAGLDRPGRDGLAPAGSAIRLLVSTLRMSGRPAGHA